MNDRDYEPRSSSKPDGDEPATPERLTFEIRIARDGASRLTFPDVATYWKALDRARQKAVEEMRTAPPVPDPPDEHVPRRKVLNVVPPPISDDKLPPLLTVEQVAAYLRRTPGAVYVLARKPRPMGVVRQGARLFFHRDQFLRAVRGGKL